MARGCEESWYEGWYRRGETHDGFCLWPTQTTDHNATKSGNPFTAELNIPKDFAAAAKDLGLKYGFYISPWDRNSVHYGTDRYVPEVFLRQCAELAQYGNDQFEMWLTVPMVVMAIMAVAEVQ